MNLVITGWRANWASRFYKFQCMPAQLPSDPEKAGIKKILLTASGGPFRTFSSDQLDKVTPEQAVNHPDITSASLFARPVADAVSGASR